MPVDVELKVLDSWGDGLGDLSSEILIKDINESNTLFSYSNQLVEEQTFNFNVEYDIVYNMTFENFSNFYESTITLSLVNDPSISKEISNDELLDGNFKLFFRFQSQQVITYTKISEIDDITIDILHNAPYELSIDKLLQINQPQDEFMKIGYIINRHIIEPDSLYINDESYETKHTYFGKSLAINNKLAIIGDPGYDTLNTHNVGAFSILTKLNNNWNHENNKVIVSPSSTIESSHFAYSLAMTDEYLIVGAFGINMAYLYKISYTNTLYDVSYIETLDENLSPSSQYGSIVSITNQFIAIASPQAENNGRVFIYNLNDVLDNRTFQASKLVPHDDDVITTDMCFGNQVKLYENSIMVTAYLHNDHGCAYYFIYENNHWVQKQQIIPYTSQNGSNFGISMDYNGNFACFGSYNDLTYLNDTVHVYKKNHENVWNPHVILNENLKVNNYGYSLSMNHKYIAIGLGVNYDDDNDVIFGYIYEFNDNSGAQTTPRKITYSNDDFEIESVTDSFHTTIVVGVDNSMIVNIRVQDLQTSNNNITFTYKNIDYLNYYGIADAIDLNEVTIVESLKNKYKISPSPNISDFDYSLEEGGFIELIGYIADKRLAQDLDVPVDYFPLIVYNDLKSNNIVISKYTFTGHNLTGVNVYIGNDDMHLIKFIETIKNINEKTIPMNNVFNIDTEIKYISLNHGKELLDAINEHMFDKKWKDIQLLELNSISRFLIDIDTIITYGLIDVHDALDSENISFEEALEKQYTSLDVIKILVEEDNRYTLFDLVYERKWLNKEQLTEMGYELFELVTKYSIPYQTLIDLGYVYSTTSGDPHIFPVYGSKYELPMTPANYRMLQGKQFILNASTRQIHHSEKADIINYFHEYIKDDYVKYRTKIVNNGSFYENIFLYANDHVCKFNFDTKQIQFNSTNSKKYFIISTQSYVNVKGLNKYEQCDEIKQIKIKFKHTVYGKCIVYLNYFSNPQIKYGISFWAETFKHMTGLLVREYSINHMTLEDIYQTHYCKCQKFKNPTYADFVITSK